IFTRKKPLADATLRRIAKGLKRHVIDAAEPFFLTEHANSSNARTWSASEPLRTQCANVKGGHFAMAGAALVKFRGDSIGHPVTDPVPTITSGAGAKRPAGAAHALGVMTAFLEQANGGFYDGAGSAVTTPMPTICAQGSHQRLVQASVETLAPEHEAGALRVAAFLVKYYGTALGVDIKQPMDTITTRDRIALVTVHVHGTPYVIVDIGLRMLRREELFRAQGFPADYIIDRTADGRPLTISRSVRMVGNSVSPPPLAAIARANCAPAEVQMAVAA
ncbi:MAG: DNA cytosine methyltransferase, partial [Cypionkella sp.]